MLLILNKESMHNEIHNLHKKASQNLAFVFFINLAFNIIVIVGGLATNSMAILADCIHDMSDTISMALAWILEHVAQSGSTDKYSYGYQRFSILGAVITSCFVIAMAFFILQESIPRLFSPEGVDARGMLIVACIGLVFKSVSVYRIHKGETFNEKAIFYHLLGDIFEWIAILIISVLIIFWDISFLDPFVSIGIAIWLIFNLGRTLYKSIEVLLQKVPGNVDLLVLKDEILEIGGVNSINKIHIWSLDGIDSILTLKLSADDEKRDEIKKDIYSICEKYHIVDITIEYE